MAAFFIADVGWGPLVPQHSVGSKILAALGFCKSLRGLVVCISHSREKCRLELVSHLLVRELSAEVAGLVCI